MAAEWTSLCKDPNFSCDMQHIDVTFSDERSHRVHVEVQPDAFILSSFVVRQARVASLPELAVDVWRRNRAVSLVGFRIDQKRRLVGEAWVPRAGLTADEFQLVVRTVAIECDRFEYVLTGRDVE